MCIRDSANAINEKIIEEMKDWKGAIPHLAIVRVGERPDDMSYERGATKKMEKVGFRCTSYTFPADIDNDTFQKEFDKINEDEDIDGILLLRPLPKHLDEKAIENRIASVKDLDGISPVSYTHLEESDMYLYPDYDTFEIFPWRPQQGKVARLICDVYTPCLLYTSLSAEFPNMF